MAEGSGPWAMFEERLMLDCFAVQQPTAGFAIEEVLAWYPLISLLARQAGNQGP